MRCRRFKSCRGHCGPVRRGERETTTETGQNRRGRGAPPAGPGAPGRRNRSTPEHRTRGTRPGRPARRRAPPERGGRGRERGLSELAGELTAGGSSRPTEQGFSARGERLTRERLGFSRRDWDRTGGG